jgi:hypothetical protein
LGLVSALDDHWAQRVFRESRLTEKSGYDLFRHAFPSVLPIEIHRLKDWKTKALGYQDISTAVLNREIPKYRAPKVKRSTVLSLKI